MGKKKMYTNEEAKAMRGMRLNWKQGDTTVSAYLAEVDLTIGLTIKAYKDGRWTSGGKIEAGMDLTCIEVGQMYSNGKEAGPLMQDALREVEAGLRNCRDVGGFGVSCAFG